MQGTQAPVADVMSHQQKPMIKKITWLLHVALFVALLLWTRPSQAYTWMIQHQYTGCAVCHMDPSGGYLLTAYGRAQTQALLSSTGKGPEGDEVDKRSDFAFGLVPHPEWLNLGATFRQSFLASKELQPGGQLTTRPLLMQADFRAALTVGRVDLTASIGYLQNGHHAAQITSGTTNVLVSREFWLGARLGEDQNTVIRVGRMYVPFGIRVIEHPFYVRSKTGTNIDSQQQWGASFYHDGEIYRMEIMAIAGNYQIAPDDYRQRGYAGYIEYSVQQGMQLGFSSMVTYAKLDPTTYMKSSITGAQGPMLRWSPVDKLAILTELDLTHLSATQVLTQYGFAGMSQVDWEMVRGLHTMVTGEIYHGPELNDATGHHWWNRDWLSLVWFMTPHIDIRGDAYWASEVQTPPTRLNSWATMGTLHVSL